MFMFLFNRVHVFSQETTSDNPSLSSDQSPSQAPTFAATTIAEELTSGDEQTISTDWSNTLSSSDDLTITYESTNESSTVDSETTTAKPVTAPITTIPSTSSTSSILPTATLCFPFAGADECMKPRDYSAVIVTSIILSGLSVIAVAGLAAYMLCFRKKLTQLRRIPSGRYNVTDHELQPVKHQEQVQQQQTKVIRRQGTQSSTSSQSSSPSTEYVPQPVVIHEIHERALTRTNFDNEWTNMQTTQQTNSALDRF